MLVLSGPPSPRPWSALGPSLSVPRVSQCFFDEVLLQSDRLQLLSDEYFTVDGTLIEAAASLKSIRPKDEPPYRGIGSSGDNPSNRWVDFHG